MYGSGTADAPASEDDRQQWFFTLIAGAYRDIVRVEWGIDRFGISDQRLEEARLQWLRDIGRIEIDGSVEPDEYKLLGFLVYWLRRRCVIGYAHRSEAACRVAEIDGWVNAQDQFLLRCNEIAAFLIGFRLCLYLRIGPNLTTDANGHPIELLDSFDDHDLDQEFLFDIGTLMKQKNLSPHSMYIIFRSLLNSRPPPRPPRH